MSLFEYICKLSNSDDINYQDLAVQSYGAILAVRRTRNIFWDNYLAYVPPILEILRSSKGNLQLQYYTLMIFWLITFEYKIAAEINKECEVIPAILDIIKIAIKEKIIRVCAAVLYVCP